MEIEYIVTQRTKIFSNESSPSPDIMRACDGHHEALLIARDSAFIQAVNELVAERNAFSIPQEINISSRDMHCISSVTECEEDFAKDHKWSRTARYVLNVVLFPCGKRMSIKQQGKYDTLEYERRSRRCFSSRRILPLKQ